MLCYDECTFTKNKYKLCYRLVKQRVKKYYIRELMTARTNITIVCLSGKEQCNALTFNGMDEFALHRILFQRRVIYIANDGNLSEST